MTKIPTTVTPAPPDLTGLLPERIPPVEELLPVRVPSFFDRPTVEVARDLLGKVLICRSQGDHPGQLSVTGGRIVEVEAYLGKGDPGSHASQGKQGGMTPRNRVMFGPPGRIYVYLIYGTYHMLNFVTEPESLAGAVLIRAIEPWYGLDHMARRRALQGRSGRPSGGISNGVSPTLTPATVRGLTSGPGKVSGALGVNMNLNGAPVSTRTIMIYDLPPPKTGASHHPFVPNAGQPAPQGDINRKEAIAISGRIGLSQGGDLPLRFFLNSSPFVSKGRYVSIPERAEGEK